VNYRPHHDKTPRLRPDGACRRHREFLGDNFRFGSLADIPPALSNVRQPLRVDIT
jgi:hypothetical protein